MADAYDTYEDNSPQSVLRVALAVALGDEILDSEEQDKLLQVYSDIRDRMDDDSAGFSMEEDVDGVAEDVVNQLAHVDDADEQVELFEEWSAAITDPDLQEIALVSALRVAGAGHDYDSAESAALKVFCELWDMDLGEVLQPFLPE